ncbi:spindle assembly abnormal protein 6 homolog isoform X1 [Teleopsis dalmanni]|uniref:spindle assembly abnormal protein 6 homolog isoform X1 n=2 Tax=Teleopsis dalmanni TaxID=139649 RepID=UPI0018CF348A|nr:spindle assembly abnormal protein 6 homolog isoform X1 [Teleopsis dalmanni]
MIEEDDYFSNISYSKNIDCIMPSIEMLINFRTNGIQTKKTCFVYAEKMDFKGLVQLRVTEKTDQRRMWLCTIDGSNFHELKQDQSLHVTFSGFIENLVKILQDCQAGKLEICVIQMQKQNNDRTTNSQYQMQFVEMRSFKNLVHLSLPCVLAPLNVVLFYMNTILDSLQKKAAIHEVTAQQLQVESHTHIRHIEQLQAENSKLRETLLESKRNSSQRHADEIQKLEENIRDVLENRKIDNERHRKAQLTMQLQIDKLTLEKANIQTEKLQDQKKIEALNEELCAVKSHVAQMKDQNETLHGELASIRNVERKNEMQLMDARKHITELQEKSKKYEKSKADIIAQLDAEKNILHTKRQALEMASAEISKANEIIVKQNQELVRLRKTVIWRTEVALHQEKAVLEKDNMLKDSQQKILLLQQTINTLRQEIPLQLASMRKFANELESKYRDQIQVLKQKLELPDKENCATVANVLQINKRT